MVDTITLRETFHHIISVLPYPLEKIRSYTDVQSTISLTCQNIYSGLLIHRFLTFPLDSGFRRNDEKGKGNDVRSKRSAEKETILS